MTLYQLIEQLKAIALRQPNVRSASEGSVYEIMNANPGVEYDAFVITQGVHTSDDNFNHFNLSLFLISRLESDLETNRLQVQSSAREVLDNILTYFAYNFDGDTGETIAFHTFTERFADECAGAWCEVTIDVPKSGICPEDYDGEDWVSPNLTIRNQSKTVEVTADTQTVTYDSGYTGLESVEIDASAYGKAMYDSGSTEGYESGHTEGYQEGYDSGHTEGYQEGYQEGDAEGYNEGYSEGTSETLENIASGAVEATYTANGTYYADIDGEGNGYISAVTVSLPQDKIVLRNYPGLKVAYSTWAEIPDYLDLTGLEDMSDMFHGNRQITAITLTDTADVTAINSICHDCTSLESFSMPGPAKLTRMDSAFYYCTNLKTVVLPDTSKVTNMQNIFSFCKSLTGSISLDTKSVSEGLTMAFYDCSSLTEIHLTTFNFKGISMFSSLGAGVFAQCSKLTTLTVEAWQDLNMNSINLSDCPLLTHECLVGLLSALPVTAFPDNRSFQIGETNIQKLTEEEIAIATDKGWTLV